jgi:hypothetical protein
LRAATSARDRFAVDREDAPVEALRRDERDAHVGADGDVGDRHEAVPVRLRDERVERASPIAATTNRPCASVKFSAPVPSAPTASIARNRVAVSGIATTRAPATPTPAPSTTTPRIDAPSTAFGVPRMRRAASLPAAAFAGARPASAGSRRAGSIAPGASRSHAGGSSTEATSTRPTNHAPRRARATTPAVIAARGRVIADVRWGRLASETRHCAGAASTVRASTPPPGIEPEDVGWAASSTA